MGRYTSYYQYNDRAKRWWMLTNVAASAMLAPELSPTWMPSVLVVTFAVALANTMLQVDAAENMFYNTCPLLRACRARRGGGAHSQGHPG